MLRALSLITTRKSNQILPYARSGCTEHEEKGPMRSSLKTPLLSVGMLFVLFARICATGTRGEIAVVVNTDHV